MGQYPDEILKDNSKIMREYWTAIEEMALSILKEFDITLKNKRKKKKVYLDKKEVVKNGEPSNAYRDSPINAQKFDLNEFIAQTTRRTTTTTSIDPDVYKLAESIVVDKLTNPTGKKKK